ncbi:MAG: hypothetical protein SCM11_12710 [Bacillota bacterium]|nr:hypothetical protein [Bacillota bacterium]
MKKGGKIALGITGGLIGLSLISSIINDGNPSETTLLTTSASIIESITETIEEVTKQTTSMATREQTTEPDAKETTTEATAATTTKVTTTAATTTKATTTAATTTKATTTATAYQLSVIFMTTPISPGEIATININGKPNTEYNINVNYSSGVSSAQGLENKTSDGNGYVSWTWKVGPRTKSGDYYIDIIGDGKTLKVNFTVQ